MASRKSKTGKTKGGARTPPAKKRAKKRVRLADEYKCQPKLRVVADGSPTVNALRAERSSAVAVRDRKILEAVPRLREPEARPLRERPRSARRGTLKAVSDQVVANCFIHLREGTTEQPKALRSIAGKRRSNTMYTATIRLDRLGEILSEPQVASVELGERVTFSPPTAVQPVALANGAAVDAERSTIATAAAPRAAHGVLLGIVDVQGFDFSHADFLDPQGETRFHCIWDQGGDNRASPPAYRYGSLLTRDHLDTALAAAPAAGLPAWMLEPQSQTVPSSHGTHVASIAGGNGGVCPHAVLAGVVVDLPREDLDRRKSFYDSTRLAHAVEFLFDLGKELGLPVSINISLGTNGHAHDASSGVSRWIDNALVEPGRSVCVAAGNAGQQDPLEPGDWGYMLGRIHSSGHFPASGLTRDLEWIVVGDGIADLSENELEIWYPPQDRFDVQLRLPDSTEWIGPIAPGEFVKNQLLSNNTFVSIFNERYSPANGANVISIYLSPFLSESGVMGVAAGTWTVRLIGREVRDGRYDAWIERDDPRRLGRVGMVEAWAWPSFFSRTSNVDRSSVSSLACGHRVISVANLDTAREVVNATSSQGPTRDGRDKPEIVATGTDVLAANGFDPENDWVRMTGTSMASPFVAGVVAQMLSIEPELTAAQIGAILRRTAQPLPGTDFSWRDDSGYGRVAPEVAFEEVANINQRTDRTQR